MHARLTFWPSTIVGVVSDLPEWSMHLSRDVGEPNANPSDRNRSAGEPVSSTYRLASRAAAIKRLGSRKSMLSASSSESLNQDASMLPTRIPLRAGRGRCTGQHGLRAAMAR
jgi:hypothetical protein